MGTRRSSKFGNSLDFSDFRPYQPGDDVRQIDWNVYARTNRHFIKRYLDEQELSITIYLDCSSSMGFEEEKWNMAKSLAAAIGYMGLSNEDRVSVVPVSSSMKAFSNKKGFVFSNEMLRHIENYRATNSNNSFFIDMPNYRVRKSALSFIISDCLEPYDHVVEQLKVVQANQQLRLIQLLSKTEVNPEVTGDVRLINVENEVDTVQVSVNRKVIHGYKQRLKSHCLHIEKACRERGIGYLQVNTSQTLEEILFREMAKKGWLS
ncbi:DUF58 domain-containing protein [Evansella tamaricis]|uniref:DUF58 domain-containing protein n=1 Tax=Evansella tamaricis TaxID=2069301 RepID=A0ABS6JI90_9BACI|nr:DUF58 domain-containing protein [Evansella tamaricis]MBU9713100.1 DUF58 domain-containing protein [Evansella tamaricis]